MRAVTTGIEAAREAASRYAWTESFELFAAADAVSPLEPDDLDLTAECAWWIGKMRHCIALRERAHAEYLKAGNVRRAARVAVDLAEHHGGLNEIDDAMAWIQKSTRMLESEPEGAEHGWLQLELAIFQRHQGVALILEELEVARAAAAELDAIAEAHTYSPALRATADAGAAAVALTDGALGEGPRRPLAHGPSSRRSTSPMRRPARPCCWARSTRPRATPSWPAPK